MSSFTNVADAVIGKRFDKPVVFNLGMGGGKSTFIGDRGLRWIDEGKGFILVVERKEDGRKFQALFNREEVYRAARVKGKKNLFYAKDLIEFDDSRNNAYFLEGYSPDICL